jgi:peptidoglycan/xylan/chitin deacetylase (PgdA/CDA1 family)
MTRTTIAATLVALAVLIAAGSRLVPTLNAKTEPPVRAMALTFDDLPYVSSKVGASDGPDGLARAQRVTMALVRALVLHHAPAVAFVTAGRLGSGADIEARTALLQQWITAGAILGNHTYAHADLNTSTIQQFEDDIVKGETIVRQLMLPHQPYQLYFRHPQTHTGDTREKKEAVDGFLAARGYAIAPHTIDSADFVFNAAYVRALASHDEATAARLRAAYADFVVRTTEFAERMAPQVFGRGIPHTILLHANDINADCLDEILTRLEGGGHGFISLDRAMADPAYLTRDTLVTKHGPTWLWRWTKSQGVSVDFRNDPEPPQWVTDLAGSGSQ